MIPRLVMAVVVAVAVTLGCFLLGAILVTLKVDVAVTVGNFLKTYGGVLGVLAGIAHFFSGSSWPTLRQP